MSAEKGEKKSRVRGRVDGLGHHPEQDVEDVLCPSLLNNGVDGATACHDKECHGIPG